MAAAIPESTRPHHAYRPDIDGLRAIAVLGVVGFHASSRLVPGGFVGVDIFFVISGYLISGIILKSLEQGSFTFSQFYARRVRRIFPALAVVLFGVWGAGHVLLSPSEYRQLGSHIAAGAGFVSNFVLWNESGYFDTAAESKPLLHLWSLGIEEQFYFIWPLLLFVCWKRRFNPLAAILGIGAISFLVNVLGVREHRDAMFYLPSGRFWELMLGGVLAYTTVVDGSKRSLSRSQDESSGHQHDSQVPNLKAICGLVLMLAAIVRLDSDRAFPGWWALLPTGGAVLLISAGPKAWINRRILSHRSLVFIGLISYPLYLWHWPLLSLTRLLQDGNPTRQSLLTALVAAFVLAWLTYHFVERPVRSNRVAPAGIPVPALLAIALCIPAVAGVYTMRANGLPERFPAIIQQISSYTYPYSERYREGRCFLLPAQDFESFSRNCLDPDYGETRPLLFLWGDSHAAHLYPGLHDLQGETSFALAQFTASNCPPILDVDVPSRVHCRAINDGVIERIQQFQPDIVLLAARWSLYTRDLPDLHRTVSRLKSMGTRTVLMGPVPIWKDWLPTSLFNYFRRDPLHRVPDRMRYGLVASVSTVDQDMRARADELGIEYVSAIDVLCNDDGCLTRIGEPPDGLVAWDSSHLTETGSRALIKGASAALFDPLLAKQAVRKQRPASARLRD